MKPSPAPCVVPKITHGQKLKALSTDTRLLLRLLALSERRVQSVSLPELSLTIGVTEEEAKEALTSLMKANCVTIRPTGLSSFSFGLHPDVRRTLAKAAATYEAHLKARDAKKLRVAANVKFQASQVPAHCPPISDAQREPHLETARMLSERLGASAFAVKMANCIVRIGVEEVENLVNSVLEEKSEKSARDRFVKRYVIRRDELLAPKK